MMKIWWITWKIRSPQRAWTPEVIWQAYEDLGKAVTHPHAGIPDLITLIRFELGADVELRPYRAVVNERFANWLARQRQAGVAFTPDQVWWLEAIRDAVASGLGITAEDLKHEPFMERGGASTYAHTFGQERALRLISELDEELAA